MYIFYSFKLKEEAKLLKFIVSSLINICCYLTINSYTNSIISNIKIAGNPIVNFAFLVLCLNVYIPAIVPIPPPNAVITKSVFSGILHALFLAFHLSIPIAKNPTIFITIKIKIK